MKEKYQLRVVAPIVASNSEHGYLLAGLGANTQAYEWVLSNYIHQIFYEFNLGPDVNFYPYSNLPDCPCVDYLRLSKQIIRTKWETFSEFLKEQISQDYYVISFLDWYYIPRSLTFQTDHLVHPVLVYGFDNKLRTFQFADFDKDGKFTFFDISFDLIEQAFKSENYGRPVVFMNERFFGYYDTLLYRHRQQFYYPLNTANIKESFLDYLSSKNLSLTSYRGDTYGFQDATFGISCLEKIHDFIATEDYDFLNYKFSVVPYERMKIMNNRICMIEEKHGLQRKQEHSLLLEELVKIYTNLSYLSIKYNLQIKHNLPHKKDLLKTILSQYKIAWSKENQFFHLMIEYLSNIV